MVLLYCTVLAKVLAFWLTLAHLERYFVEFFVAKSNETLRITTLAFSNLCAKALFSLVSVWLLVCQRGYTKSTERISTKLGSRMGYSPKKTPLIIVVDPDKKGRMSQESM